MSFHRIFSFGDTPEQALIYAKINEIGYNTKSIRFLKKTEIELVDNISKLELKLYLVHDIKNNPSQIKTEALINLKKNFSEEKLNKILNIYCNPNSERVICLKEENNFGIYKNMYRFLY